MEHMDTRVQQDEMVFQETEAQMDFKVGVEAMAITVEMQEVTVHRAVMEPMEPMVPMLN